MAKFSVLEQHLLMFQECSPIDLLGNNCIPFAEVCDKHNGIAAVIFDSGKS